MPVLKNKIYLKKKQNKTTAFQAAIQINEITVSRYGTQTSVLIFLKILRPYAFTAVLGSEQN